MAAAKVSLRHSKSREVKEAPVGFSWTTLCLGFIVAFYRNDRNWSFLQFLLIPTVLPWFIFPFIYNKLYIRSLLNAGYIALDEESRTLIAGMGINVSPG
ncbi:MAG: hypothetical protein CME16_04320 [Gemmatimonadetes bacterium]|nr:hypothetical protein [Gemmatimonadota bacterium]